MVQTVKQLNLEEALKLWSILGKYINQEPTALGFVKKLISTIPPSDYLACIEIFTGTPVADIKPEDSIACLHAFVEGLSVNKVGRMKELESAGLCHA